MIIADVQKKYWDTLSVIYDLREAKTITKIVFEKIFELEFHKLSLERFQIVTTHQQSQLNEILKRLISHEPVQHILGEADFCGLKFRVNKHALIPRPETEELVEWIISECGMRNTECGILDVGTGSGCIAISLAKKIPSPKIEAVDVSEEALKVAEENNELHQTKVKFRKQDILKENLPENIYNVIVSNPPYISLSEKDTLPFNVLNFEPHSALFTGSDDSLIFYKKISQQAAKALKKGGQLFFEINEARGKEVVEILKLDGFKNIELKKDLSGKDRMVKGEKT